MHVLRRLRGTQREEREEEREREEKEKSGEERAKRGEKSKRGKKREEREEREKREEQERGRDWEEDSPWNNVLTDELRQLIALQLNDAQNVARLSLTSKRWHRALMQPVFWHSLVLRDFAEQASPVNSDLSWFQLYADICSNKWIADKPSLELGAAGKQVTCRRFGQNPTTFVGVTTAKPLLPGQYFYELHLKTIVNPSGYGHGFGVATNQNTGGWHTDNNGGGWYSCKFFYCRDQRVLQSELDHVDIWNEGDIIGMHVHVHSYGPGHVHTQLATHARPCGSYTLQFYRNKQKQAGGIHAQEQINAGHASDSLRISAVMNEGDCYVLHYRGNSVPKDYLQS